MKMNEFVGQIVRHFKGDLYLVQSVGRHTETGERMVAYKALYGEGDVHYRPMDMFLEYAPNNADNVTGQAFRFEMFQPKSVREELR